MVNSSSLKCLGYLLGVCLFLSTTVHAEESAQPGDPALDSPQLSSEGPMFENEMAAPETAETAESANVARPTLNSGPFAGFMDPFDYDPRGRRDPFAEPVDDVPVKQGSPHGPLLPLQRFELAQLRLVGIIWNVRQPKAMVKDPEGMTHVVSPNAKIGPRNGYVAVIREGEMVVVETVEQDGRLVSTAQVVKIAK